MITHRLLIEVIHHRIVTSGKEYNFWGRFEEKNPTTPLQKPAIYIVRGWSDQQKWHVPIELYCISIN